MDFRLNVFVSVANNLSFTKAALQMNISQPAVSNHIRELEEAYRVQLFERTGNSVALTSAGVLFLKHANVIIDSYRDLFLEMSLRSGRLSGELRIGASTTIAQYVLPRQIAIFINRFPDVKLSLLTGNSQQIERAILEHKIDFGLVESNSRHGGLKYADIYSDELILVTSQKNRAAKQITVSELATIPMVLREAGSGTLEVIEKMLAGHNIKLSQMNILLQLGSTESIKSFLLNCCSAYAIVSVAAVAKELVDGSLRAVDIDGVRILRSFSYVALQGAQNTLADEFMLLLSYNQ